MVREGGDLQQLTDVELSGKQHGIAAQHVLPLAIKHPIAVLQVWVHPGVIAQQDCALKPGRHNILCSGAILTQ